MLNRRFIEMAFIAFPHPQPLLSRKLRIPGSPSINGNASQY